MKTIEISKTDDGIRLDKFLFKLMPSAPSSVIYKALRKKRVKLCGKRVTDGSKNLKYGDVLELYINDEFFDREEEKDYLCLDGNISVVYSDENIVVMNKPKGMPSQDGDSKVVSLESEFRAYLYKNNEYDGQGKYIPSLCHRIDRNTSGLVIGAKNIKAHRIISEKIRDKEIRKFYLLNAEGYVFPREKRVTGYITKIKNNRVSFSEERTETGKLATLSYKVVRQMHNGESYSVVEVELESGRTHQIRATMSYLGHPLVGDIKYGAVSKSKSYQELKAYKIIFDFKTDADNLNYLKGKEICI